MTKRVTGHGGISYYTDESFLDEPDPPDHSNEKFCKKCNMYKPLTEFYKRGSKKGSYYAGYCKVCHTAPFKYDGIRCPHCKEKIHFFGVNPDGSIAEQRREAAKDIVKELQQDVSKATVVTEEVKKPVAKNIKNVKDLFK